MLLSTVLESGVLVRGRSPLAFLQACAKQKIRASYRARSLDLPDAQTMDELVSDSLAFVVHEGQRTLDRFSDDLPKALSFCARNATRRALDGRCLPGESFSRSLVQVGRNAERPNYCSLLDSAGSVVECPTVDYDAIPDSLRPLAVHLASGGTTTEYGEVCGMSRNWAYTERAKLAECLKAQIAD